MLLEYVGCLVIRLFTTCEDSKRKLQDYSQWRLMVGDEGEGDKVLKGLVQSALRASSKCAKEGENVITPKRVIEQDGGSSDASKCGAFTLKGIPSRPKIVVKQEVGNIVVLKSATLDGIASKKIIEQEDGNNNIVVKSATLKGFGITSKKKIEQEDGSGIPPRGEFEFTTLNSCSGKEVSNKFVGEIETLEQHFCAGAKNSTCCEPGGYCELGWRKEVIEGGRGGENEGESFEMAYKKKSKKKRKAKKFWKKFVARHMRKKRKHKLDKEQHQALALAHTLPSLEEITSALEDGDDPEDMVDGEGSSSSSDEDDDDFEEEEWLGRAEHFSIANQNCTKMLKTSSYESVKSSENFEERGWNLKCVTIMGIALAGLVIGRIFALVVTVVSCVMFKMLRI